MFRWVNAKYCIYLFENLVVGIPCVREALGFNWMANLIKGVLFNKMTPCISTCFREIGTRLMLPTCQWQLCVHNFQKQVRFISLSHDCLKIAGFTHLQIVVHQTSPRGIHFRRAGPRQKVLLLIMSESCCSDFKSCPCK